MANLVELSNQLEDFPEQQLVQMSQDPNSMYPSYLVLSEIQRRNQMRKMYEAQQPKPETTVAEEVIGEFAGQQGLQGAMAQSPGPQDAFPPSDMGNMAPPSPMQAMASGGRTGYQVGGFTPTGQNPYPTGSELVSDTFTSTEENPYPIDPEQKNAIKERYTDPDGTFAYGRALKDGFNAATLAMIFAPEPTSTGIGAAARGLAAAGKGLYGAIRNPRQTFDKVSTGLKEFAGRRRLDRAGSPVLTGQMRPETVQMVGGNVIKDVVKKQGPRVGAGVYLGSQLLPEGVKEQEIETAEERAARLAAEANAKREAREADIAAREQVARDKEAELLAKAKESRQADMLVGLGGAIGSAKNLGELSSNISDAYFGVQSKRDAKDLAGLQGRLIEAQASKYEADVANMGPKDIINEQNSISAFLKQANDGAIQLTEEQKNKLAQRYFDLQKQLDTFRSQTGTGFAVSESPTGGDMDIFKKTKIPA
tara:strand:+ start:321 stop:1757 length:1437 start_codon:yes stop_codon:yes gene_type:complete